jgi:uncharacterized protein (DUF2236 family)
MRPASDVSRRINAERLLLLAWLRAILLQLAHPLIAAGVSEHSTFRGSTTAAWGRLRHTVDAMIALTFGTDAERDAAVDGIRAIHRRVAGTLTQAAGPFAAGTRYSAEDPALLTWVHATLIESMVLVYEELIAPLSSTARDRYCDDAAELAVALGASPDDVPRSWNEVRAYIDRRYASGEIVVGQQALAVSAALLCPIQRGRARKLSSRIATLLAAGLLPDGVRVQYGFGWNLVRAAQFARTMSLIRRLRRVLPGFLALWKRSRRGDCIAVQHDYSPAQR